MQPAMVKMLQFSSLKCLSISSKCLWPQVLDLLGNYGMIQQFVTQSSFAYDLFFYSIEITLVWDGP